ncbi:MAG TPA: hypothetical protein VLB09_05760 [Nitrospiria bacterium]|nr:hypothetical protein [Nitrospiria bacterium]
MSDEGKKGGEVFNFEMELEVWRQEYLNVRDQIVGGAGDMTTTGQVTESQNPERRTEPRHIFTDDTQGFKIFAQMGPRAFQIINISIGGMAFYSEISFPKGERILMSALGMIALEVEVLDCEMEEVDANLMEYRYRVRAKFGTLVNGYQVYVLAREMHLQREGQTSSHPPPTSKA